MDAACCRTLALKSLSLLNLQIGERVRAAMNTWHASGDQALLSLEAIRATMATCKSLLQVKGTTVGVSGCPIRCPQCFPDAARCKDPPRSSSKV